MDFEFNHHLVSLVQTVILILPHPLEPHLHIDFNLAHFLILRSYDLFFAKFHLNQPRSYDQAGQKNNQSHQLISIHLYYYPLTRIQMDYGTFHP